MRRTNCTLRHFGYSLRRLGGRDGNPIHADVRTKLDCLRDENMARLLTRKKHQRLDRSIDCCIESSAHSTCRSEPDEKFGENGRGILSAHDRHGFAPELGGAPVAFASLRRFPRDLHCANSGNALRSHIEVTGIHAQLCAQRQERRSESPRHTRIA